jgi:hypothetical protein
MILFKLDPTPLVGGESMKKVGLHEVATMVVMTFVLIRFAALLPKWH